MSITAEQLDTVIIECDKSLEYITPHATADNHYMLAHKSGVTTIKRFAISGKSKPFSAPDINEVENMFQSFDAKKFANINMQQFDIIAQYAQGFVDYIRGDADDAGISDIIHKLTLAD